MNTQLYPTDLTDSQWDYIKDLIPPAKPGGRPRTLDMRMVINGILYVVVGGIQWRMLPQEYPKWKSVYDYFRTWRNEGIWRRIHDTLRAQVRRRSGRHKHATAGCLDSQSVKTTAIAGVRGYDKGKQVKGRKRHLLVDTLGLLMAVIVTVASKIEMVPHLVAAFARRGQEAAPHLGRRRLSRTNPGLGGRTLSLFAFQIVLRHENQKRFVVLPHRWVVERTFAWLNHHRRLSKDYEVLTSSSEAMIYIVMIRLMLRRLAHA